MDVISSFTVKELQVALKKRNADTTGLKAVLIDRLQKLVNADKGDVEKVVIVPDSSNEIVCNIPVKDSTSSAANQIVHDGGKFEKQGSDNTVQVLDEDILTKLTVVQLKARLKSLGIHIFILLYTFAT